MEPTANETQNPNPTPTDYKLSSEGQALREQLTKAAPEFAAARANRNHPGARDFNTQPKPEQRAPADTPTAKDADGTVVDLVTGEVTKGTPPDGGYTVSPETALIPQEHHEEAVQIARDLEAIGQAHGYTAERMQTTLDAAADIFLTAERDLNISTKEQGEHVIHSRWGDQADTIISEAQRMAAYLGKDFQAYLEQTGLGNSVAVVALLAANFRGDLSLTPEQARAKITELRKSDRAMERDVIDRVKILNRVANPKSKQEAQSFNTRGDDVMVGTHQTAAELRAELKALQAKDSPLWGGDGPLRAKAVKRRAQIQADLAAREGR
jgi:hypothetical protein